MILKEKIMDSIGASTTWCWFGYDNSSANKDYGYMWWINSSKEWKDVSAEIYFADGSSGNYIVVDIEHELLVVARWIDDSKMGEFLLLIEQSITNCNWLA